MSNPPSSYLTRNLPINLPPREHKAALGLRLSGLGKVLSIGKCQVLGAQSSLFIYHHTPPTFLGGLALLLPPMKYSSCAAVSYGLSFFCPISIFLLEQSLHSKSILLYIFNPAEPCRCRCRVVASGHLLHSTRGTQGAAPLLVSALTVAAAPSANLDSRFADTGRQALLQLKRNSQ